jgi:spore coat polysaccharide biosynthesis protein SpsF
MKTIAIIQARYGSSRLPGKVLLHIRDKPMLTWVAERTRCSRYVDEVVIATTTDTADDAVAAMCAKNGYLCYRGDLFDVLDRYYQTARTFGADVIVRITADCPLIDPDEIDHTVEAFLQNDADFAANRLPPPYQRTYPIGLDTEVCSFAALERAWQYAEKPYQREHVMPYLYDNVVVDLSRENHSLTQIYYNPPFKIAVINHDPDYGAMRWTVDTMEDLELVRAIVAHFEGKDDFSWLDVLELLHTNPRLMQINSQVQHKAMQDVDHRNKV